AAFRRTDGETASHVRAHARRFGGSRQDAARDRDCAGGHRCGFDADLDPPGAAPRRRTGGTMIAGALVGMSRLLSGASVTWRCDPHADAQRIYFANHCSHLDFVVIWSSLPPHLRRFARPVAGRDYWEHDAVRRYLAGDVFNAVLIDR